MHIYILLLCMMLAMPAWAQNGPPPPPPEADQFDFWLGKWDLTWEGGSGTNTITRILDDRIIHENFDGMASIQFKGQSVSVFNRHTQKWHQTWVDNHGGYLDFVGEFKDGKMILSRTARRNGQEFLQRMVWYNIEKDRLDWNWEKSEDDGKTWTALWQIHYERKK